MTLARHQFAAMRKRSSRSRALSAPRLMLLTVLLFGIQPPRIAADSYNDLLTYLQAVGNTGQSFVSGLLAPRFDVRHALELLRGHMGRLWPAVGLPRLDPLDVRVAPFHLDDEELGSWWGRVERARVTGLSGFQADSVVVEPLALSVSFNATWRRIDVAGRYVLNGSLAGRVPSRGRGPFNVTLWDARVWGRLQLGSDRAVLYVRDLQLGLSLGAATGRILGLRGAGSPAPDPISATESPRALRVGALLSETTLEMAPLMVETAGPRLGARLAAEAREALDRRMLEGRAATATAMAWARAAAAGAVDRVLAFGRGRLAPDWQPSLPLPGYTSALPVDESSAGNSTSNSTWAQYFSSIYG